MSTRTRTREVETDLTRFYALFPQPYLARDLFNIVEGHRIDQLIRVRYPGIRRDMDATHAFAAGQRPDLGHVDDTQVVVEALLQRVLGVDVALDGVHPQLADPVRAALAMLDAFPAADASVNDSARLAAALYGLVEDAARAAARNPVPQSEPTDETAPSTPRDGPAEAPEAGADSDPEDEPLELPPVMPQVKE